MDTATKVKLKAQAHALNPVIMIGQAGLTDAVLAETEIALDCHELIKVKIRAEREDRKVIAETLCLATKAELIQSVGQVVVIYRKKIKRKETQPKRAKPTFGKKLSENKKATTKFAKKR